jgi:hypothetical protein
MQMKKALITLALVATAFVGAVSTAQAGYYQYQATCGSVWVQTGPFIGQGYYAVVCN